MEITGKIKAIGETQTFGSKGFKKRELVITTDEQYPQHILIEFVQDKCDLLDKFKVNATVKVSLNLRGREWINPQGETKYFNSIQGWRIESALDAIQASADIINAAFEPISNDDLADEQDDLPF
jgi:hypothetical protein